MSKYGHVENLPRPKRKRKRDGVSTHSSLLVPVDAPPSTSKHMRVFHTNVEDPYSIRKSTVQISSGHQGQGSDAKPEGDDVGGDDFVATVPAVGRVRARPKRKRRNDTVSRDEYDSTARN